MTDRSRRLALVAIGATLVLAACSSPAAPAASGASATPAASTAASAATAASATPAATTAVASATPSSAPAVDLTTLDGEWIASIEDIRLNYATGDLVGAAITVDGERIRLKGGGMDLGVAGGAAGPRTLACKANQCQLLVDMPPPALITVLDDGTLALVDIFAPDRPVNAGAGLCDAPIVDGAGVIELSPDGQRITFVNGSSGAIGEGAGAACDGSAYQVVWTQVLTRAP